MTQGIEARADATPVAAPRSAVRAFAARWWLWLGVGGPRSRRASSSSTS